MGSLVCEYWICNILSTELNITYGVEHIPKEITEFIRNKNIITNIYRIQVYNSIMCRYFGIGFINFMIKDKSLIDSQIYLLLMIMRRMMK